MKKIPIKEQVVIDSCYVFHIKSDLSAILLTIGGIEPDAQSIGTFFRVMEHSREGEGNT